MIPLVKNKEGHEGFIVGYSSGDGAESEWEEVLVACMDGRLQTCRTGELTFLGLMTNSGLRCVPAGTKR